MSIKQGSTVVGNFCWCKILRKYTQNLLEKFSPFLFRRHDALTTPLPVDGHTPHTNLRNNTEQESKEASFTTTAESSFCVKAFAIMEVVYQKIYLEKGLVD